MVSRGIIRYLSSSRVVLNNIPKSSCPAGTVLNLKVRKNGEEPVALEDSEYPEWLWGMLDKKKMDEDLKEQDLMKWRRRKLRKENTKRINSNNFLSRV